MFGGDFTGNETWDKVMAMKEKDTRHKGIANNLDEGEIETILGTIDYFGGNLRQAYFDLTTARYRVFDFLAMCVMGDRIDGKTATKVLVHSFLKVDGNIDKWIADLRMTDYDIDNSWEAVKL